MRYSSSILAPIVGVVLWYAPATAQDLDLSLEDAWVAWKQGDVALVEEIATKHSETDEGVHLLVLCFSVRGQFEEALSLHGKLDPSYRRFSELDNVIFQNFLHMHRYDEAARFAEDRSMDAVSQAEAQSRLRTPLVVNLETMTTVPFADHPLTPYFPAFSAAINDEKAVVHLDTGGNWLIIGPARAEKLGIDLVEAGEGFHASQRVSLFRGVARSFRLGDAVLENVPVVGIPTLIGEQDFIIFGTNVLQQFHATMDYPNERLILSPRRNEELTTQHMEVHGERIVEVPFFMWGDHYMFARGKFGEIEDLNYFVDSGLVALDPNEDGVRQACFIAMRENYEKWGVASDDAAQRFFESELPLCLGPLEQVNQYFTTTPEPIAVNFGGIQIDGLISHAFLKKYTWTLDFERMIYVFSSPKD